MDVRPARAPITVVGVSRPNGLIRYSSTLEDMGYHVVTPEDIEPTPGRPSETRDIREALGLSHLGLRTYNVEPGEDIPYSGMHYHETQEEVFYVIDGTLSVETPDEVYEVETGELFVAEPESPHRAFNDAEASSHLRVLGIGAPQVQDGHAVE